MNELQSKETITSLELLKQINTFRKQEDGKTELGHNDLLKVVRDEFEDEIGMGKIPHTPYIHPQNKQTYHFYTLTHSQAKQVLVRESKAVRKAVIKYIEELEKRLKSPDNSHLSPQLQYLISLETKVMEVEIKVDSIKDVVSLSTSNWRSDCRDLINKMAQKVGGHNAYQEIQREIYKATEKRAGVKLEIRLTNMKQRSLGRGMSKTAVAKINKQDVIAEDKKLIEIYIAVVKDFAIKYGI